MVVRVLLAHGHRLQLVRTGHNPYLGSLVVESFHFSVYNVDQFQESVG